MPHLDLIKKFELQPHPEGGYYAESYRAQEMFPHGALPPRFSGDRLFSTAIYYLLQEGQKSKLHRIKSDEVWHFYLGDPLEIIEITPSGRILETTLGQDYTKNQKLQYVVPTGHWFGARPAPGSQYSFVGCTVSPGFDFADFEIGQKDKLHELFPHARSVIEKLA